MFTIFDLIQLVLILAGLISGVVAGSHAFGWLGAVIGGAGGLLVGFFVGRIPWLLSWALLRRGLKRGSIKELRGRVETQYFISHLILAELVKRGEPVESFRGLVAKQLHSESPDVRRFGKANAGLWFPDLLEGDGDALES